MTPEETRRMVGGLVRIAPVSGASEGSQHYGRGRLVAYDGGDTADVHPFGHKHPEKVAIRDLKPWKSANVEANTIRQRRDSENDPDPDPDGGESDGGEPDPEATAEALLAKVVRLYILTNRTKPFFWDYNLVDLAAATGCWPNHVAVAKSVAESMLGAESPKLASPKTRSRWIPGSDGESNTPPETRSPENREPWFPDKDPNWDLPDVDLAFVWGVDLDTIRRLRPRMTRMGAIPPELAKRKPPIAWFAKWDETDERWESEAFRKALLAEETKAQERKGNES